MEYNEAVAAVSKWLGEEDYEDDKQHRHFKHKILSEVLLILLVGTARM